MKPPITLSINPTYLCNFRCPSCYLTPEQLSDTTCISISRLIELLQEVSTHRTIEHVDLYGGEIGTLGTEYQRQMYAAIRMFYQGRINVVTNLLRSFWLMDQADVDLSVSYDFEHRERHTVVYRNMKQMSRDIHVLVLATPEVISGNVDRMIEAMNSIPRVVSVEIKPYSSNQANQRHVPHVDFEQFIMRWIKSPVEKQFDFTNEREIRNALTGSRNSFSDDHLYITPTGQFAVLDFDLNDNEYFKEVQSFDHYLAWTEKEKQRTFANSYCNSCEYLGRCLTEHLRVVHDVNQSCNGYYNLIRWYKNETMETQPRNLSPDYATV